ncbi:MAG: homocysteine S-methyltransferase family protein, partial [Candidatus Ranarchaeia archaeon]
MTKPSIIDLAKWRKVILDGAMTPVYQQLGFLEDHHTGEWSLKHPARVQAIHKLYWQAGADAVSTNTPPANRFQLRSFGHNLESKHDLINRRSAELAVEICPPQKYVFGDIGPTGKLLEPLDDTPVEEAEQAFADQAGILVDSGVDFLLFETFFNLTEALAAVRGGRSASKNVIIAITAPFQWHEKRKGWYTMMGASINKFFDEVTKAGADILGVNCIPSSEVPRVVPLLKGATKSP